jgi:hypothetical protein
LSPNAQRNSTARSSRTPAKLYRATAVLVTVVADVVARSRATGPCANGAEWWLMELMIFLLGMRRNGSGCL